MYSQRQTSAIKQQFFGCRLKGAQRLLHDAILRPGSAGLLVLDGGKPEEQQPGQAEARRLFHFFHRLVDGQVVDPGHGADFAPDAFAGADKERDK